MPTRRTIADPPIAVTPAVLWFLMLGAEPTAWMSDWYELAMFTSDYPEDHETRLRQGCWPREAAALTAEAARYKFKPWGLTGREPHGPGVEQWKKDFLARHGRHPAA